MCTVNPSSQTHQETQKSFPFYLHFVQVVTRTVEFIFPPLFPLNSISQRQLNAFDSQVTTRQGSLSLFNQLQQD